MENRGSIKISWQRAPGYGGKVSLKQDLDADAHISEAVEFLKRALLAMGYQSENICNAFREAGED